MLSELRIGSTVAADGAIQGLRGDRTGATVVTDAHGRYYEAAARGALFAASNVGAQAVSVALATTYTGLVLCNPLGNTKNFALLGGQYALSVAPAAIASIHLIAGYSATTAVTHTTPLASPGIQNCLIGSSAGTTAKVDSAATIVSPGYLASIASGFTAAALPSMSTGWIDFAGQFVLIPGSYIAWGALTAVTGFGSFVWEEISI